MRRRTQTFLFLFLLGLIIVLVSAGPPEKTLGANVRIVYLHGAWVWTALAALSASALAGLGALITRRPGFYTWSCALGRTGLLFWVTYLPVSMWAMQANWNGLFLAEPRWRVALVFAVGGLLLQTGLALVNRPVWTAAGNLVYFLLLISALMGVENVMHPASPIFGSEARSIQVYFLVLLALMFASAGLVARGWKAITCN